MKVMIDKIIKRKIYEELKKDLDKKEIAVLIGPRQAGKTTLMKILQGELEKRNEKTLFLSLDFEHDRQYFSSQQSLLKRVSLEMGNKKGFVFIDEIQRKENAGLFLKGIYDMDVPYKFIVSGSGSIDLKAKIRESMVGRKRVYELSPVSLKEFVNFRTDYKYEDRFDEFIALRDAGLEQFLLEYMNFGGYPRVVLEAELREKLRVIDEIYRGYVEKDISYILKVEKVEAFSLLIKVLADQIGKLMNYSEISNTLGISLPTLKNYLWYAENTFILQLLTPYFRNIRSEMSKSPTVYFHDLGLRNFLLGVLGNLTRPEDQGFAFQNLVFLALIEKLRGTGARIHFWRSKSGAEIDFIVETGKRVIPIEVKYSEFNHPVVPRSFGGFIEKYAPERCLVVNKNLKTSIKVKRSEVLFLTIWDLMTENLLIQE
jgi:predicted AAA+ superfamily ATPase